MKTTFQKTTIVLVMFVFAIAVSCNEQSRDITPTLTNFTSSATSSTTEQETSIIARLQQDEGFKQLNEAINEIENRILDGQFKRLITDENAVSVWKNKLSMAKNEAQINALLSEMYSAPQLMMNAQKASLKFFNGRNISTKFPELARLSMQEKARIFSKVFPRKLNFRSARLAQVDPASQCAGGCSNQLNIDWSTARTQLWIDGLAAAANDDYVGLLQAVASYLNAFDGALSSFENCWNGCL